MSGESVGVTSVLPFSIASKWGVMFITICTCIRIIVVTDVCSLIYPIFQLHLCLILLYQFNVEAWC